MTKIEKEKLKKEEEELARKLREEQDAKRLEDEIAAQKALAENPSAPN